MGFFNRKAAADAAVSTPPNEKHHSESEAKISSQSSTEEDFGKKQAGVRKIEAAAKVWTKWHLIAAYTMYV